MSAFAVAAGFAVTAGVGAAAAAPGSVSFADGASALSRTIDNTTPTGDDIVTVTTRWDRSDGNWEELWWAKDFHATCLTYLPGSAKVTDAAGVHPIEPYVQTNTDNTAVDFAALGYKPVAKKGVDTPILSVQYKVGYDCARGTALTSGMSYNGSRGSATFTTTGPAITVSKNSPTTTLAPVSNAKVGNASTLTATLAGGGAQGDIVEFYDGTTKIGQGPLAAGNATLAWTPTTAGGHSLTAKFLGTAKANQSVSAEQNVAVTPANVNTETTVTGDTTGVVGTDVALSVQVSPAPALGGKVQFKNGTTDLGGPVDLDAQGNASIAVPLAAGEHAITAVFAGLNEHQASTSAAHNVTVTPANVNTETTVTGPTTAVEGTDVVLGVQVSPAPAGGTVQFKDGTENLGGPVTLDSEGKGSITQQFATGARSITAVYSGAGEFLTSTSGAHNITVSAPAETDVATTTVLTLPATATKGAAVNLVATVSPTPAGGTVQFMDGTTPIGAPVGLLNGKATRSHPFASAGEHQITAIYSGAPGHLASTAEVGTVTVEEPVDGGTGSAGGSLGNLFGSS